MSMGMFCNFRIPSFMKTTSLILFPPCCQTLLLPADTWSADLLGSPVVLRTRTLELYPLAFMGSSMSIICMWGASSSSGMASPLESSSQDILGLQYSLSIFDACQDNIHMNAMTKHFPECNIATVSCSDVVDQCFWPKNPIFWRGWWGSVISIAVHRQRAIKMLFLFTSCCIYCIYNVIIYPSVANNLLVLCNYAKRGTLTVISPFLF